MKDWRPKLSGDFCTAARLHAGDVALAIGLYAAASFAAGRAWRFPFDDELIALTQVERSRSALALIGHYLKAGDIHPPLSFLWFYGLNNAGLSEAAIRLFSMTMTATALGLSHLAALTLLMRRHDGAPPPPASRLIAILTFGLCALAVSQGDAIRWYPMFAALIAVFVTLYVFGGNDAARLWSAVPLGLAASVNFIVVLVAVPFAIYRYLLQRQFNPQFDAAFAAVALLFAGFGVASAIAVVSKRLAAVVQSEFGHGVLSAVLADVLGFFGGAALGVGQAWIVLPAIVIAVLSIVAALDRARPANPLHLLVLMLAAAAAMALAGFAKPRSFLYLAPVLGVLTTLYFDSLYQTRRAVAAWLAVLSVMVSITAIANIEAGRHPFKRSAVIPYQDVLDFIGTKGHGRVLVLSSEPVIPWVMRHRRDDVCAAYLFGANTCTAGGVRYDSIFIVGGHAHASGRPRAMRALEARIEAAIAGRRKIESLQVGRDDDAGLKSYLTGVPLDRHLLTVDIYQ